MGSIPIAINKGDNMKVKQEDCKVITVTNDPSAKVTHIPSGNVVTCKEFDNLYHNFDRCMEELEDILNHYEVNDG